MLSLTLESAKLALLRRIFVRRQKIAMESKTPLYDAHVAQDGKMVPFAGYILPVEYKATGLMKEHEAVRTACGMFDVSHMGEVTFEGEGALAAVNHLLTNDYTTLAVGRCRYGTLCQDDGGMLDDVIVYRLGEEKFLVVVNAANRHKDVAWMREHLIDGCTMEDISDGIAQIAVQGPASPDVMSAAGASELPEKYYSFVKGVDIAGVTCLVSRTGYTGEDGFEVYCAANAARMVWDALLAAGAVPCGLGARDTLRLEAAMPLYGHEMDETVTPLETGLDFGVKLGKDDFIGKDALIAKGDPARERIGLHAVGRGIVREHCDIFNAAGDLIGHSTSGTYCPHLKGAYAMALVNAGSAKVGDTVEADVRGRRVACEVVPLPFYRRKK